MISRKVLLTDWQVHIMSFYINFNIDGDVDDNVLDAIAATCDSYDAECVRKYKNICTLGGSAWRNGYDMLLRATDAKKVGQEKPDDADDFWYEPPTYIIDARKLLAFLTMVKPLNEDVIGRAIDLANDHYDGCWFRASDVCDRLGIVPVDAHLGDVAVAVDDLGHVEHVIDDDGEYEANVEFVWLDLADKLIDADADNVARRNVVDIVARAMRSVYAYCTDSRDGVVVPGHLVDEALAKMRKHATDAGIDASCADDLLDFVMYDGWKIDNMLYEARHVRVAVENGIDELLCVI